MQPTKLVIASILKPVDDTRMYEKFAKTLVQTKKYEINIIGFWSKKSPAISNIIQHPIFKFKRLSIRRWFASILYYRVLIKLKPAILIVTSHELLPASIVYKAFYPSRVIYDVRENYYRNIKYLNTYPAIVKDLLAIWVRCKETLAARFIDHFILAEKCYSSELPFVQNRYTIVENKAEQPVETYKKIQSHKSPKIVILFTGTIASSTGIFECIETIKNLHALDTKITLKIVGYCPDKSTQKKVELLINNKPYIELIGDGDLVSHEVILKHILQADFGFIYYPPNKANDHCIPTKVYEYLAASLPYITTEINSFQDLTTMYHSGMFLDFNRPNYVHLLQQLYDFKSIKNEPKTGIYWEEEKENLLDLLDIK